MNPTKVPETSEFDPATHMRTPTGMKSGFHIDALIEELRACRSRAAQITLLESFHGVYHLNDGFWLETSLMLHLAVDAPGFAGDPSIGFTIDVFRASKVPLLGALAVPLECAPGHVIEVYGNWKTKLEEWIAGEKWCPMTRKVPLPYPEIPTMGTCPPLVNPHGEKS